MAKNITIDLVNNKITADALVLYDAVMLTVLTGQSGTFSADAERTPKLTVAWHRFPLLEDNTNWNINEDGSNATIEFVLNSFELKDSFVHIPAKGYRQFEFNVTIPKNNSAVASARLNVKNNTLEGIPFSQQDRDKLDSIDLSLYYTKVEVDDLLKDIEPGGGGETYTFLEPLSVDKDNVVSINLTAYAKLTDLPNVPKLVSAFTNDAGYITLSALNGYATESFVTSQGYITSADIPDIPVIPTNISAFYNDKGYITLTNLNGYATETFVTSQGYITLADIPDFPVVPTKISAFTNDVGYITLAQVPTYDLTPYALKTELFSKSFTDLTNVPTTIAGYGITDANINGRVITLGGNSIEVPEGGSTYILTKEAVDEVIGASATGSATMFYNQQGVFANIDLTGYATETFVTSQGYITISALSGYATESFVTSQGYITIASLEGYATATDVSTAVAMHNTATDAHSELFEAKADKTELSPTGTVIAFAGNSAPNGYLICNGAAVSRTTYASLFAVIGTTYGAGNGSTTFNLPNLTDKFIMGSGTAGTSKGAGLPNITGSFAPRNFYYNGDYYDIIPIRTGAFSSSYNASGVSYAGPNGTSSASTTKWWITNFDASNSNSIYGNSTTVQPPALTMRFYIKY